MTKKPIILALSLLMCLPMTSFAEEQNKTAKEELTLKTENEIIETKIEGKIPTKQNLINQLMIELIDQVNSDLDKGKIFTSYYKVIQADELKEENEDILEEETLSKYKTLKLRYENILTRKLDLVQVKDEISNMNYEEASKMLEALKPLEKDKSYDVNLKEIKKIVNEKKKYKDNDDKLKELESKLQSLEDKDYEKAKKIINELKIENPTDKQKERIENLKKLPEDMEKTYQERLDKEDEQLLAELQKEAHFNPSVNGSTGTSYTFTYNIDDEGFRDVIKGAYEQIGKKYIFGASDPSYGFDCSGLTHYLYRTYFGINLPRTAAGQATVGRTVNDLKQGDLLFFNTMGSGISHVGIYVGDGKFIHAANPGAGVKIDNLNQWYVNEMVTAKRIVE